MMPQGRTGIIVPPESSQPLRELLHALLTTRQGCPRHSCAFDGLEGPRALGDLIIAIFAKALCLQANVA